MSILDKTFESITKTLDIQYPCEWDQLCDDNCKMAGKWALVFKEECGHGSKLDPPHFVTLCDRHKNSLLSMMTPWSNYVCIACGCRILAFNHLVTRIAKL